MGIYLNPGNRAFQESVNSKIYVDKTGLLEFTNSVIETEDKYICVSRPRRFGKSMAVKMLAAYYDRTCDSHALFDELKVSGTVTGAVIVAENGASGTYSNSVTTESGIVTGGA